MASAPTKFGFAGGEAPAGTSHPRSLPTLLGHDTHSAGTAPAGAVPTPLPTPPPAPPSDEQSATAEQEPDPGVQPPLHSGKSNYPTVARLFGRWNQDGQLVAEQAPTPAPNRTTAETASPTATDSMLDGDSLVIPRQGIPRWVLAVIAAAVVFAVVAFLIGGRTQAPPPAAAPAPASSAVVPPAPAT